ncbi:response regulator, partial [Geomonas sp.]|uniref:response regulator n=1 Tax=Geomonas sp. TaxID=2651584 RepID=UPI002B470CD0
MNGSNGHTVLLIDDDDFVLESVSDLLTEHGYTVSAFDNGGSALDRFRQAQTDVVLTDIKMPCMDGIELLKQIRLIDADTPVILTTGFAELDMAVEALKKGAFDFISKPFQFAYLLHAVDKGVQYKRMKRLEQRYRVELEQTVAQRTRELTDALWQVKSMSQVIIERLTAATELRDEDTGAHISRIGIYSGRIAGTLGLPREFVETITTASAMHDVGKIGIPDAVLLKPGPLTAEEFGVMK